MEMVWRERVCWYACSDPHLAFVFVFHAHNDAQMWETTIQKRSSQKQQLIQETEYHLLRTSRVACSSEGARLQQDDIRGDSTLASNECWYQKSARFESWICTEQNCCSLYEFLSLSDKNSLPKKTTTFYASGSLARRGGSAGHFYRCVKTIEQTRTTTLDQGDMKFWEYSLQRSQQRKDGKVFGLQWISTISGALYTSREKLDIQIPIRLSYYDRRDLNYIKVRSYRRHGTMILPRFRKNSKLLYSSIKVLVCVKCLESSTAPESSFSDSIRTLLKRSSLFFMG